MGTAFAFAGRCVERLRSAEGRFIVVHGANSLTGFALTFAQFVVFVRVLEPGFFAEIILLTTGAAFLMPIDESLSRFCYVLLTRTKGGEAPETAWRSVAATYLAYVGLGVLLTLAVAGLLAATGGTTSQTIYFLTCLFTNAWLYHCQAIGWARERPLVFECLEFARKALQVALLGLLFVSGDFLLYVVLLAASWPLFYAAYFRLQAGRLLPRLPPGIGLDSLRPCLAELRHAFGGSLGQFALMNVPYAWASLLFGVGSPIIVLDVVLKIVRAALHAFHLATESFLQRQTRAWLAGDRAGVVRALALSVGLALVPAVLLFAVIAMGDGILFRALLGSRVGLLPPGLTPLLLAFIGAALFLNAATSFLSFLGFFRQMARVGLWSFAGLLALGAVAWAADASLTGFLWLYFAVFALSTVVAAAAVATALARMPEKAPPSLEGAVAG